jgi:type I restriction-modification system DNA methylase subunit
MWEQIAELTNQHGYMSGVDREPDRVKATGEVYTPTELVIEMMQKMLETDPDIFAPGKTILDPACGDGQLLVPVKWFKVLNYDISEQQALNDIYGVDIMRDNVDLCKKRLGGGNIIMANTLEPYTKLDEQTDTEYQLAIEWFGTDNIMTFFE